MGITIIRKIVLILLMQISFGSTSQACVGYGCDICSGYGCDIYFFIKWIKCQGTCGFWSHVECVVPHIQKCQLQDSACLKSTAQKLVPILAAGISEIGSDSLDPMHIQFITIDLSGLKMTAHDAVILGVGKTIVDELSVNMDNKHIHIVHHMDLNLNATYKATGKLLILPISGDGEAQLSLKNCKIVLDMFFDIKKNKDGKDIIALKSYKYTYDIIDYVKFKLTNLFNGNKVLSEPLLKFMNENWKSLTEEFGAPMFEQPVRKSFNAIKAFLKSYPMEEIIV